MSAATSPRPTAEGLTGLPNWADLHTSKVDRARRFYAELLGWDYRPRGVLVAAPEPGSEPGAPASTDPGLVDADARWTAVATIDDGLVVEIVGRGDSSEADHLLANWFPYVEVDDVDATLELVEPAGGLVLSPPATRSDEARVATILDPSDALLRVWQAAPGGDRPAPRTRGSLAWIELETDDLDRARTFYGTLFGWQADEVTDPAGGEPDLVFSLRGEPVAGVVRTARSDIPASWCTMFSVADTDESMERAVALGGVVMNDPTETSMGRQAVLVDPAGAVFGLLGPIRPGPRPL